MKKSWALIRNTGALMKPLRSIPPGVPHITLTMTQPTIMIDLGTYEVPFNAGQ